MTTGSAGHTDHPSPDGPVDSTPKRNEHFVFMNILVIILLLCHFSENMKDSQTRLDCCSDVFNFSSTTTSTRQEFLCVSVVSVMALISLSHTHTHTHTQEVTSACCNFLQTL